MKVGVGIADIMCGMYATTAILAALHHRDKTGEGQYIDLSLLDSQIAWLANVGLNYLTSGEVPQRVGNEHPNIVPYNVMASGRRPSRDPGGGQRQPVCEILRLRRRAGAGPGSALRHQ